MSSTSRSSRSSISPFRSRKSAAPQPPSSANGGMPRSTRSQCKAPISPSPAATSASPIFDRTDSTKAKENVTVTVRFRPLSPREISKGDEIAWFADGDYKIQNEYNPSVAYSFDRVFGPATTTRHVYDVAAQHVVSGAMNGINGTVFAYGVTSSGKTHTMHGEQKSPGIIPLAVKDVFGIIQEMSGREFLLRVSYLEIYNEVINDLLDPTGQNLRIREDAQGTYVEGIKDEVVLSPAHALSLIASGEAHRHVGSNNFNLLSSRSHTIFTMTIESSPRGDSQGEEVTLSQLHLIDLAGSESSKTETTGLRRKEGSYINKSLLTLGTVISKLTDGKATHIPYRDSKLTRLLQSSLSGHGRVSLICTVTPASSNTEETHNTLKFAYRSKHMEIKASQNKIIDEKSLIKKYQKEISNLKQELEQLKCGMMTKPDAGEPNQEDIVNLKLQLEAGQVKLQSRLEEEEQAKAALLGRIQRLTKLILVSTKNTLPPVVPGKMGHRRRHSFGENELAYLPERTRDKLIEDDVGSLDSEFAPDGTAYNINLDELVQDYKRNRRRGMLGWFKFKKPEHLVGLSPSTEHESSASDSPASSKSTKGRIVFSDTKDGRRRKSVTGTTGDPIVADSLLGRTQAGDLFSATVGSHHLPPTGTTITDQMDLLREQVKMLTGEVALCSSSLKRLSEQASTNPKDSKIQEQMQKLKVDIREKKLQIRELEQRLGSAEMTPHTLNASKMFQAVSQLGSQLDEKTFELEIKSADNRILQEQLQTKTSENAEMQETILLLRQQLDKLHSDFCSAGLKRNMKNRMITPELGYQESFQMKHEQNILELREETCAEDNTPTSVMSSNRVLLRDECRDCDIDTNLNSQLLMQAAEIETLKQEKIQMTEEKDGLIIHNQKLAEECLYAKELAAAAAVELRNLAEEVTKLTYQNAMLTADLTAAKDAGCKSDCCQSSSSLDGNKYKTTSDRVKKAENGVLVAELEQELNARYQREASLVAALAERDKIESGLRKRLDETNRREGDLENELANMWVLVSKMQKSGSSEEASSEGHDAASISQSRGGSQFGSSNGHPSKIFKSHGVHANRDEVTKIDKLRALYYEETEKCKELESLILRLKGGDIDCLDINSLEELQNLHVEAITKICHAKALCRGQ